MNKNPHKNDSLTTLNYQFELLRVIYDSLILELHVYTFSF